MISLTEVASTQLCSLLRAKGLPDHGLRVFVQGGGCAGLQYGMAYENAAREDDTVLEIDDVRLYVDPFSARYLDGATIDYVDTQSGSGFRVDNPNAAASCACGSSFCAEGESDGGTTSCC
jgi:iron-sulfur cluster assembly protein